MTGSEAEFGINASLNVFIPMRDGIRLATDIYRPALPDGKNAPGHFPVILGRTSYDKSNPVIWVDAVANFFTPRGYVVMLQDLRGRGRSEGTGQYFHTANRNEGPDGFDTIEWAAAQDWCSGRVGMVGSSHGGIVQNMASLYRPPHLSALWVDVAPTNAFAWEARQGGAMALHMFGALFLHGYDSQEIRDDPEATARIEQGAENLRELVWQTPFRRGSTPIAEVPHLEDILMHYYRDGVYNDFWAQESLDQTPHFGRMADIPAVYSGGWYDPFAMDVTGQFAQMAKQNSTPQRLIMGPWNHVRMRGAGSSIVGEVEFGPDAYWGDPVYNEFRLAWFDRWLKDIDTGVEDEPPVRMFVMGGGDGRKDAAGNMRHGGRWRAEKAWPLERAVRQSYFLDRGGALTATDGPTDDGEVTWSHDPEHPVPSISANVTGFYEWIKLPEGIDTAYVPGRARMRSLIEDGPRHQKEEPGIVGARAPYPLLADRPDVIVFQTPALDEEIEVTGASDVRLWISSSAPDTDFTVKLLDICPPSEDYPDGFHLPLVDSILRARFREGFDHEAFLEPDEIYEIVIPLPPISNLFAVGHRIRLDVASSNFPRFDINPNTGEPMGQHTHQEVARNTVHFGPEHPSRVTLPIIPAG
jgi:putative CocE/NonD family hydrolase